MLSKSMFSVLSLTFMTMLCCYHFKIVCYNQSRFFKFHGSYKAKSLMEKCKIISMESRHTTGVNHLLEKETAQWREIQKT